MVSEDTPVAITEYLAECLWPGVTQAEMDDVDARARSSAEVDAQRGVRYLGSILMPGDEVVFFVFTGPSARAVQAVATGAEIPFERIVPSIRKPTQQKREEE
jgi:hypothetical protein